MRAGLPALLAARGVVMADGATGTNLFEMGLEAGGAPELWNVEAPEKVRRLYQSAVEAGADLFLTNSFGGNAARLKLHGAEARVRELNMAAAGLAREVADTAARPVAVAGSMGPTGELIEPVGSLAEADAQAIFAEQAAALVAGGVDVLWVETIAAPEELRAAATAIAEHGAPWCVTMSFDTAGRTMMGVTAAEMVALAEGLAHPPVAYGANCGVGASDLVRTVREMRLAGARLPLIAKGNAGIPKFVDGHVHYDGTPSLMADYAALARACGARIIGGCCGTGPAHLQAMRAVLDAPADEAEIPAPEAIAARLGPFQSGGEGAAPAVSRAGRRRRRG